MTKWMICMKGTVENAKNREKIKNVTRKGLRDWYNGYYTKAGERVYNPRSVFLHCSLTIWQITGPAQVHMMKFIITFEIMYPTSGMTLY